MNLYHLSESELVRFGIFFGTIHETDAFINIITDEFSVRVGMSVAKGRTKDEMQMFKSAKTKEEQKAWLDQYCPDYKQKVCTIEKEMEQELLKFKKSIPGVIKEGSLIIHRALGDGKIIKMENDQSGKAKAILLFGETEKTYTLPDAFREGRLEVKSA